MSELELLASVPTLGKLTEQFLTMKQPGPFARLFKTNTDSADGMVYIWPKLRNDRRLAPPSDVDVPAYIETAPNERYVKTGLVHLSVKERITPKELFIRSGIGSPLKGNARSRIIKAVERNMARLYRGMEYISAKVLQNTAGVDLSNSNTDFPSGATFLNEELTIDNGLQTLAAGAQWDIDTTELVSGTNQLEDLISTFEGNGYAAGRLIINRDLAKQVSKNLEAQTWLTANGGMTIDFWKKLLGAFGEPDAVKGIDAKLESVLSGIGDIPIWSVWHHTYEDRSGTTTRYMDNDKSILLPSDEDIRERESLVWVDGPVIQPNEEVVIGDAAAAEDLFNVTRGVGAYAYREHDDVGALYVVHRASFLPLVKDELSVLSHTGLQ